jgi:hypothetical protein
VKGGGVRGSGPQTDKHLLQSPCTGQFFQMTTFCIAFSESYLSTAIEKCSKIFGKVNLLGYCSLTAVYDLILNSVAPVLICAVHTRIQQMSPFDDAHAALYFRLGNYIHILNFLVLFFAALIFKSEIIKTTIFLKK